MMPFKKSSDSDPTGKCESIIASIHRQFSGSAAIVTQDERIPDRLGTPRQVDVAIRARAGGLPFLVIVECKEHNGPVPDGPIDELARTVEEVGANKGFLVSDSGFTAGAIAKAAELPLVDAVSVDDSKNPDLRTRIVLPVHFTMFRQEGNPDFGFDIRDPAGTSAAGAGDSRRSALPQGEEERQRLVAPYAAGLRKRFREWYNVEGYRLGAGEHVYEDRPIHVEDLEIVGKARFRNESRCFVNEDVLAAGAATMDHTSRPLHPAGTDDGHFRLNLSEIEETWREVPAGYELGGCTTYLATITKYRAEDPHTWWVRR